MNTLVVTGKAIYAGSCYKVICHFTFAVEIPWCYHPKGTIHFLKLKKKNGFGSAIFCNSFFNIRSERVMEWRRAVFAGCLQELLNFNSFLNRLKLIENQWESILKIYFCACFKPVCFRFCLFSFFQNTFKIVIKNSLK